MDRREMLEESFRSLARAVPSLLGVGSGLAGLLKGGDEDAPATRPGCFPPRKPDSEADPLPETDTKEE